MKKLRLVLAMASVLIIASCGNQEQETVDLEQSAISVTKDLEQEISTLIYFDDTKLAYFIEKQSEDLPDTVTLQVYLYDRKTGENKCLLETSGVNCSTGNIRVLDKKLYYPLFGYMSEDKEYNRLLEVDLENFTAQLIPIEDANAPFVNIAVTDQDVFLLKRNENGEDCIYTIERLSGKKFTEIAQKTWLGEEGEFFLNIYGENGLLYTYCGTSSAEDYFLCMTREGEIQRQDNIDSGKVRKLEIEEDPKMEDSPWDIMKKENYYIISTLNHRNIIFKIGEKELTSIKVPIQLDSKDLTYGATLISNFSMGGRYVFFQETSEKSVFVFDSQTGKFGHFNVKTDGELERIIQNGEEQFLFQVRRKDDTVDYLLYDREDGWKF